MAEKADDPTQRFYDYYEKYVIAKQGNAAKETAFYALMSLSQIHQIADGPDTIRAAQVMHRLMGLMLTEGQTREMYDELRKDSGVAKES
jgi:hypothetical protein